MVLNYDTVAIPVVKGIDITTKARLVDPTGLLEAENSRFPAGSGATKRRGHAARRVRGTKTLPSLVDLPLYDAPDPVDPYYTGDRSIPADWLFGWGPIITDSRTDDTEALATSEHPDAGLIFGSATRDNETLAWNGHQLFSLTTAQDEGEPMAVVGSAVMPILRAEPTAKVASAQIVPQACETAKIRLIAWLVDGVDEFENPNAVVWYTVQDAVSGAPIIPPAEWDVGNAAAIRVVSVGDWVHLLALDDTAGRLHSRAFHDSNPDTYTQRSLGDCTYFDVTKVDSTTWVVARTENSTTLRVNWYRPDGQGHGTLVNISDTTVSNAKNIAIAVHPVTGGFALVWRESSGGNTAVYGQCFDQDGTAQGIAAIQNSVASPSVDRPVAVAPKYIYDSSSAELYDVYVEQLDSSSLPRVVSARLSTALGASTLATRYHQQLASQAFRVGDRTFIWLGHSSPYQSTWFLVDEALKPVGHMNFITANVPAVDDYPALCSINWTGAAPVKDTLVFHLALGYRLRVPVKDPETGENTAEVFAEPSIQFVRLDFLPPLRSTQAGRCTYFAGAQVWCYDGASITEAGFHLAPEDVTPTAESGGALTVDGVYKWRVDLCYRNAQNEEVRSHSFYTTEVTLSGANKTVALEAPSVLTRRDDAYLLFFRNESAGTQWYLVNSRDPSSDYFIENDQTTQFLTFTDDGDVTDAELTNGEQHPGNGGVGYLDQYTAPACEIIASGQDRVWVAGGEISAGQVHPSRLFDPGYAPAFNLLLQIQVDRSAEAVTAIGFVGDVVAIFRKTKTYILDSAGPDNSSGGSWVPTRLAYADLGAVGPEALALISQGLCFQSPAGIRLLSPSGGVAPIGFPVDSVAKTAQFCAAFVSAADQEVRFYARSGPTLVYNYQHNIWSTWAVVANGVTRDPSTGLAVLAHPEGSFWTETDDLYLDNGAPFRHRIRFAWLRAGGLMDFQRVRKIGAVGEWDGSDHSVHVDVYFDERDYPGETFDWDMPDPDSSNEDSFGSGDFGDGFFGDTSGDFHDSVWRWKRRLNRKRCSVISVAIDDNYTNGPGFVLTALALNIGIKKGLDRTPWRGGSTTNVHGTSDIGNGN